MRKFPYIYMIRHFLFYIIVKDLSLYLSDKIQCFSSSLFLSLLSKNIIGSLKYICHGYLFLGGGGGMQNITKTQKGSLSKEKEG